MARPLCPQHIPSWGHTLLFCLGTSVLLYHSLITALWSRSARHELIKACVHLVSQDSGVRRTRCHVGRYDVRLLTTAQYYTAPQASRVHCLVSSSACGLVDCLPYQPLWVSRCGFSPRISVAETSPSHGHSSSSTNFNTRRGALLIHEGRTHGDTRLLSGLSGNSS